MARSNQHDVLHKQCAILVEDIIFVLRTVGDGFLVMKSLCNIVRRFAAVFYTCYSMTNHDMALNVIGKNTPSALFRIPVGSMQNDDSLVR